MVTEMRWRCVNGQFAIYVNVEALKSNEEVLKGMENI